MQSGTVRRPSLPLTQKDEDDLAMVRGSELYREALARLSGESTIIELTESAFLHAVLVAGIQAVRMSSEEAGYAILAAERAGNADQRRAVARRRPPSWAAEEA
jgi:hypothetical protein